MIEIRPLESSDDRTSFRCGDPDLDRFFHKYAGQNQFRHHLGVSLVASDGARVLGFVTIAASAIEIEDLPEKRKKILAKYPLPVLRLARLAVDRNARGMGVGKKLLREVFRQAWRMSSSYGCVGIVVDAKQAVVEYYKRFSFDVMESIEGRLQERPQPVPMFIPLGSVIRQK